MPLQSELDELLAEITKDRQSFGVQSKVLVARADALADELEKTDFSDLEDAEKKAVQDLNAATAEEITSLDVEEEEAAKEE